jgi:hypothetical protein
MQQPIRGTVLFATYYGSKLYGTAGPNSDTDIRGVFLPLKEDCLLGKAPQHYNYKAEVKEHCPDHEDVSYLSLQYFLQLLTQGETNCLDMFFSYTNKSASISSSPAYEEMVANKDKLITKNVAKYLGYCKSQALKYSIKGDRIQNYEALLTLISDCKSPSSATLSDQLRWKLILGPGAAYAMGDPTDYMKGTKHIGRRFKISGSPLGDHCYMLICDNQERYLMVSDHLFPLNANLNTTADSIHKCLKSYGKRAFNAAEDNGADYKALSHALRVAYQAQELLRHGEIHFPLTGGALQTVREIKFKQTDMTYDDIVELIQSNIEIVENNLLTTKLPEKPDWEWINGFILRQYGA